MIKKISEGQDSNYELALCTFKGVEKCDPIAGSVTLENSSTSTKH